MDKVAEIKVHDTHRRLHMPNSLLMIRGPDDSSSWPSNKNSVKPLSHGFMNRPLYTTNISIMKPRMRATHPICRITCAMETCITDNIFRYRRSYYPETEKCVNCLSLLQYIYISIYRSIYLSTCQIKRKTPIYIYKYLVIYLYLKYMCIYIYNYISLPLSLSLSLSLTCPPIAGGGSVRRRRYN